MEEGNIRVRYSDKELEEFKALIEEKIKKAQTDLELIKSSYMNSATNGTDDTSPTFEAFEEGSKVTSKEENTALAIRQEKFKRRLMAVPHATLSIEAKNMQ